MTAPGTAPRGYTDFHNHLIPGVDDGARDEEFSAGALAAFRQQGVYDVITTPHFNGGLTLQPERLAARLAELDAGWEKLERVAAAAAAEHPLPALFAGSSAPTARVFRGAEVMLNVPDPDLSDARIRLAGTRFVLVEFAGLQVPPVNAVSAFRFIAANGWIPVLAHPERYRNLQSMQQLREFMAAGALLQVNTGSLLGEYGRTAQARILEILGEGLASFACSDYHARGEPSTARFAALLLEAGFAEQATLLLAENPARLRARSSREFTTIGRSSLLAYGRCTRMRSGAAREPRPSRAARGSCGRPRRR
ncbi:MAG: hypothetical protein FJ202_09985 [Gemmatimonadetes bacterium]|nr:hypothetical protein [Gemmatimonadota bacterium]